MTFPMKIDSEPQEHRKAQPPEAAPENSSQPVPSEVVPQEIQRELAPHTEVRLICWLRREYWTNLISLSSTRLMRGENRESRHPDV